MSDTAMAIILGLVGIVIFFWLVINSKPRKKHEEMTGAERLAYEEERGRRMAIDDMNKEKMEKVRWEKDRKNTLRDIRSNWRGF